MSASVHAAPPAVIPALAILPENLPDAWAQGDTTALVVSTALPQKVGKTLPWKAVRDVIADSLQARFTEVGDGLGKWPCELRAAGAVRLKAAASGGAGHRSSTHGGGAPPKGSRR